MLARTATAVCLIVGMGSLFPHAVAQPVDTSATEPTPQHRLQLQNCRDGILDPRARPEDRRRWITTLFAFDTPSAKSLIVDLLTQVDNPEATKALCDAIATTAQTAPQRLSSDFVNPLLDLLGAESADLRSAAARALAGFPGTDVPAKLGALAARPDVFMAERLAAIDALVSKVDRRNVIDVLMTLLDSGDGEITDRVVAALEPATRETFGKDLDRWRAWWSEKSKLSEQAWLSDQLKIYRDRLRLVEQEARQQEEQTRLQLQATNARLRDFQREVFRNLTPEQKETKLAEWLADPLEKVKHTALSIIQGRIADEGQGPSGEVLKALLLQLKDKLPETRREVLLIVQTLKNPTVVEAVLAQLKVETDPSTRLAIFKAIGHLDTPHAIAALVTELETPDRSLECVREAALALGKVAPQSKDPDKHTRAVSALKARYQSLTEGDHDLQAALLSAMAGVADSAFAPEFLKGIDSTHPGVLRAAIGGLIAIGEKSRLARLRTLTEDEDPRVRLAAVKAIGSLGVMGADLERILPRLGPTTETNELVRQAAFQAFRSLLKKRALADRIDASLRLHEVPELEINYLAELAQTLTDSNGTSASLEKVHSRLSDLLVSLDRYGEAVPHLRRLYKLKTASDQEDAYAVGLRWLGAALRSDADSDITSILRQLLAQATSEEKKAQLIATVAQQLESPKATAEQTHKLLSALQAVPADTLGNEWTQLLQRVSQKLKQPVPASPPSAQPS